jgi:FtsP/CotA-like multicopper oxidase with cupredoxin domain
MKLDDVNEWSVKNATTEWHSFHIHVNNFQVTGLEGQAPKDVSDANARDIGVGSYQDTVVLPPGKTVTFRTKPTDFTGKFVFHCHMTNHEDRGMMAVTEVTK